MANLSLKHLRVGISFDRVDEYADVEGPADRFAEFEPTSTIEAMEAAVRFLGCTPVRVGGPRRMLTERPDVDVIWNISEGYGTRNREAWVPVLCEMYGIPCLGSDAATLSMSLDKVLTKQIARQNGIPTANWMVFPADGDFDGGFVTPESDAASLPSINTQTYSHLTADDNSSRLSSGKPSSTKSGDINIESQFSENLRSLRWPLFLKPRYEGTGKGITAGSVIHQIKDLMPAVEGMHQLYEQDILVEEHLPGAEFTVALSGSPLRCHPVLERAIDPATGIGIHVLDDGYVKPTGDQLKNNQSRDTNQSNIKSASSSPTKDNPTGANQTKNIFASTNRTEPELSSDDKSERPFNLTHALTPELEFKLQGWSLAVCSTMQVKDFARLDFKLDADGNPHFLEINPLPTFAIDNTYAILAELEDTPYDAFLAKILDSAIRRTLRIQ